MTRDLAPERHLLLGGARAGKSTEALRQAERLRAGGRVGFVATARPIDEDMTARIARHQQERSSMFHTVEEPLALAEAIAWSAQHHPVTVVDCLTVWLANVMFAPERPDETTLRSRYDALAEAVTVAGSHVILVSNEVGWSIHPEHASSRRYVDELGRLNQQMAATCHRVSLVVAGLVVVVKTPDLLKSLVTSPSAASIRPHGFFLVFSRLFGFFSGRLGFWCLHAVGLWSPTRARNRHIDRS